MQAEPNTPNRYMTAEERFWMRVEKGQSGECWRWTGFIDDSGYGTMRVEGKKQKVHRYAYGLLVGPIPTGLTLDHLCRVRACVNPNHLEPVTHRENVLRGSGPSAKNARKTHCPRGHELTPANLYNEPGKLGRGRCRICQAEYIRDWQRRKRAADKGKAPSTRQPNLEGMGNDGNAGQTATG